MPNITSRRATSHAAVVCCRPTDDRACQVKGLFAGAREATARERPFVMEQWERFVQSLERIGVPRRLVERWVT